MFSQSIVSAPGTARSKRRTRPSSTENSASQPKAKRHRSSLNAQTFLDPNDTPKMDQSRPGTAVAATRNQAPADLSSHMQELTVRPKKRRVANDRIGKADGSTILTSNEIYAVSKLPALPDRLRTHEKKYQHGAIYSDTGFALSLSHTHAVVWPYSVNSAVPETFTFTLPQTSKQHVDALPLGTLVSASASEHEPGLVVVMPATGKICYWESISSAATLDLIRKKQNGLEGSVPSMFGGETVVQLLNAEAAGFVLAFSSGRLAYMSVRDGQGRPAITVQFLRTKDGPRYDLLSSVRNILSGPWKGDIAAIRAGPFTKVGERDVVTATSKGILQAWKLQRGGHNYSTAGMDTRQQLVDQLKNNAPAIRDLPLDSFQLLDLAFSPNAPSNSQLYESDSDNKNLVLFVSMTGETQSYYALIEITLTAQLFDINRIIKISSYTTPLRQSTIKPRLYIPSPGIVAFLVFDRSVVLVSMTTRQLTPEMQRVGDIRPVSSKTFEDVIDFRDDLDLEINGSGEEEPHALLPVEDHKSRKHRAKCPGVVLLVGGVGLVRIAAIDTEKLIGTAVDRLSAKSKLEQAVFFRTLENNPLSFMTRPELQFDAEKIGRAALELSEDILDSKTSHVSSVSAVLEQHLGKRAAALRSLAEHLNETNVVLDRSIRWGLLTDAEKLFGATRMWKVYETAMKKKPADEKKRLLAEMVEFLHESQKTNPVFEDGEVDRVRFWFIKDISRFNSLIPWTVQAIRIFSSEEWEGDVGLTELLTESEEYLIAAIGGAYEFREKHLELYRLQNERLKNGFVVSNLQDLPQPWTGTSQMAGLMNFLLTTTRSAIISKWSEEKTGPEAEAIRKLASHHPNLVDVACTTLQEFFRWATVQIGDSVTLAEGKSVKGYWIQNREELMYGMVAFGQSNRAIELAKKHEVLPTVADIIYKELSALTEKVQSPDTDPVELAQTVEAIKNYQSQIDSLYQVFGDRWAKAVFELFADEKTCYKILLDTHQAYMTRFLRPKKEFAKIAWINEVINEKNIQKGAEILLDLSTREQQLWNKKVELSIGKLALLVGGQGDICREGLNIPDGGPADLIKADNQLSLIKIQEQVFESVFPTISCAIDEKAGVELATARFGNKDALKGMKVFPAILESHLCNLIAHKTLDPISLIDLLTLMDATDAEPYGIRGREFHLALKVMHHADFSKEEQTLTERVILRRCLLRDNWSDVNNTVLKDDRETSANLGRTAFFSALKSCLEDDHFQSPASFQTLRPSDILGACSEAHELGLRFSDREESAKMALAADMMVEDNRLEHYMKTCQLEKWWQECLILAKDAVNFEVHQKTVDGAEMKLAMEEVRKVEEAHFRNQKTKAFKNARAQMAPLPNLREAPVLLLQGEEEKVVEDEEDEGPEGLVYVD